MKPALKTVGVVTPMMAAPVAFEKLMQALLDDPTRWPAAGAAGLALAVCVAWFLWSVTHPNVETGIESFDQFNNKPRLKDEE